MPSCSNHSSPKQNLIIRFKPRRGKNIRIDDASNLDSPHAIETRSQLRTQTSRRGTWGQCIHLSKFGRRMTEVHPGIFRLLPKQPMQRSGAVTRLARSTARNSSAACSSITPVRRKPRAEFEATDKRVRDRSAPIASRPKTSPPPPTDSWPEQVVCFELDTSFVMGSIGLPIILRGKRRFSLRHIFRTGRASIGWAGTFGSMSR